MIIPEWPINDRPREKLIKYQAKTLADSELLAILLRHGSHGLSAIDMARRLINTFGGLRGVFTADFASLCAEPGIGSAKYCQLQAAAELGRRCLQEALKDKKAITHSREAQQFIMASLRDYHQEVFAALFLDNNHQMIQFELLFYGTINMASIYPREVAKRALYHNAAAMIVAHNHPSGNTLPSLHDKEITLLLKETLALIEVKLLDHLIIGHNKAASLAELGFL